MPCFKAEHMFFGKSASHPHRPWPAGSRYECANCIDEVPSVSVRNVLICVSFRVLRKGKLRPMF